MVFRIFSFTKYQIPSESSWIFKRSVNNYRQKFTEVDEYKRRNFVVQFSIPKLSEMVKVVEMNDKIDQNV